RRAGLEAEHARSADALSGGVFIRRFRADTASERSRRSAFCDCVVHRQRRERLVVELFGAVDEQPFRLVAPAGRREPAADRTRRNRAHYRSVRTYAARLLAPVLSLISCRRASSRRCHVRPATTRALPRR